MDRLLWDLTHACTTDEMPRIRRRWTGSSKLSDRLENISFYFQNLEKLETFDKWFSQTHSNTKSPFIHSCLFIKIEIPDVVSLPKILLKFGAGLVHFGIRPGVGAHFHEFLRYLSDCLEMLPSLKFLEVFSNHFTLDDMESEVIQRALMEIRFRRLPLLKHLFLDALEDKSYIIQTRLVSLHAEQLTRLQIRISTNEASINIPTRLLNLKELHIAIESQTMTDKFISKLLESTCPPRLIKLGLTFCPSGHVVVNRTTFDKFFQLFNIFGETLKTIRIDGDYYNFEDVEEKYFTLRRKLICPALECIEIIDFSRLSLNFLKNFEETIQDIFIDITTEINPRFVSYHEEFIDLYDHVLNASLYDCSIWEALSRLQFIDFEYKCVSEGIHVKRRFTRNTYRRLHF